MKSLSPFMIFVSGSSGVGKTTFTRILQAVLGENETLCISGDDMHRWERSSPAWNTTTHLNPDANDLETNHDHIVALKQGKSICRRHYNHDTGKFDPCHTVDSKDYVIYEGLHALYHTPTNSYANVKIFVDTDESLKTEWKIKRDTKKRGYTETQVVETMRRRRVDEERYITPQRDRADIIVKFNRDRDESVSLEHINITGIGEDLMVRVKDFYDSINEFISVCKWLSLDPSLTQGRGGNVSVKSGKDLIIKSSGTKMGDINLYHGFCVCVNSTPPTFETESAYMAYTQASKKFGTNNPSMETAFHMTLPERVVVHTHPVHLNALLCSNEARANVKGLFQDLSYDFIEYTPPGTELANRIRKGKGIVFLENHGLIVGAETSTEAMRLTEEINNRCKRWLGSHTETFVDIDEEITNDPLFPDAAIFPSEMSGTNNYILRLITGACLTPKFLTHAQCQHLAEMELEKHRKNLK
jgi:uridine kinase/ribulose-5-phosphate 4-epimerase/fuculose-1-phosphate aldolase